MSAQVELSKLIKRLLMAGHITTQEYRELNGAILREKKFGALLRKRAKHS